MSFSPDDNHIIVNYHYVREPSDTLSGIHPCRPKEFERQIKFLSSQFRIAGIDEVFDAAEKGSKERLCALTFDDGFKDNFDNAFPVLERYGIKGTFFPIAQIFKGLLPTTHKVHIILSTFPVTELVRRFNEFLEEYTPRLGNAFRIPTDRRITTERKIFDDVVTANFKETMSIVPKEMKKKFLDMLCNETGLDERNLVKTLFMSQEEIKKLKEKGHTIGSHGLSHDALDCLSTEEAKEEIHSAKKIIGGIIGEEPTLFSYPQSAPNKDIFKILEEAGVTHSVIVNKIRGVQKGDHPLLIPRYDTNDVREYLKDHLLSS